MAIKVLITGFPAFHTHKLNPTESISQYLKLNDSTIIWQQVIIPVEFDNCAILLQSKIKAFQPDYLIMLGLAASRTELSLERVAVNILHSEREDNQGEIKTHQRINSNGKAAYFSTLPLDQLSKKLSLINIPNHISNYAGTYVCNLIFYKMMEFIEINKLATKAGFIHVPKTKELSSSAKIDIPQLSEQISSLINLLC
jgi:pyroglutamyl-peptidase